MDAHELWDCRNKKKSGQNKWKQQLKDQKKLKLGPLTISEDHWAQIPERYCQEFDFLCHRGSQIFEPNRSNENPASHEEDSAHTSETEPDHQNLPTNDESKGNEDTGNEDKGEDGWSDEDEFGSEDEYLISWKQAGRGTLWPHIVESDKEDCGLEEGSIQNSEGLTISEPSTLTDSMRSIIDAVWNVHEGLLELYGRAIKRQELTCSSLVRKTATQLGKDRKHWDWCHSESCDHQRWWVVKAKMHW